MIAPVQNQVGSRLPAHVRQLLADTVGSTGDENCFSEQIHVLIHVLSKRLAG